MRFIQKFNCTRADYNEQVKLGDTNATSTISQLSNMQIEAKISADRGATLKSKHRNRFTLFPKLLFEIRTMIWDLLCKESRIVEVEFQAYRGPESLSEPAFGYAPRGPIPALLQVCSEARHHGLKHYTRVLQRPLNSDYIPDTIIYMNLEKDTLCILPRRLQPTDHEFYTSLRNYIFKNSHEARETGRWIKRLAIPMPPTGVLLDGALITILKCCCRLSEVVLVRNWEAKEESQSAEPAEIQYRSYASARSFFEPGVGADVEGEALIKILKAKLDRQARRYAPDPVVEARQANFLFKSLTYIGRVSETEVGFERYRETLH